MPGWTGKKRLIVYGLLLALGANAAAIVAMGQIIKKNTIDFETVALSGAVTLEAPLLLLVVEVVVFLVRTVRRLKSNWLCV